jgi:hypothetical protein
MNLARRIKFDTLEEMAADRPLPMICILVHGFIKKPQKTPTEDRALALKRKHAYIQNS